MKGVFSLPWIGRQMNLFRRDRASLRTVSYWNSGLGGISKFEGGNESILGTGGFLPQLAVAEIRSEHAVAAPFISTSLQHNIPDWDSAYSTRTIHQLL